MLIKRFRNVLFFGQKILLTLGGGMEMGTIICQVCEGTIEQFEDEKITVLYGNCCSNCKKENKECKSA